MSNAVSATGILVQRALLATPTVFVDIGEITQVGPPGFSRNKLEASNHNEGVEAYVLGILRQKDPTFTINYVGDDLTHQDLVADIMGNIKNIWQVLFPSGVSFSGEGYIQQFELADAPVDAIQQANCTISWAGIVTFDDGTGVVLSARAERDRLADERGKRAEGEVAPGRATRTKAAV
jgi:hypothetical protein